MVGTEHIIGVAGCLTVGKNAVALDFRVAGRSVVERIHQLHNVLHNRGADGAIQIAVADLSAQLTLELLGRLAIAVFVLTGADGKLYVDCIAALRHKVVVREFLDGSGAHAADGAQFALIAVVDPDPADVVHPPERRNLTVALLNHGDAVNFQLIILVAVGGDILRDDADRSEIAVRLAGIDRKALHRPRTEAVCLHLLVCQHQGALAALREKQLEIELVPGSAVVVSGDIVHIAGNLHLNGVASAIAQEPEVLHGIGHRHIVPEA